MASDTEGEHTLPGEPKGEWVPDSDEEPEGFLGASLVFWDMKRVKLLPQKKTGFSVERSCDKKYRRKPTRQGRNSDIAVLQAT